MQKNQKPSFVNLPNGKSAMLLVPETSGPLAIVDFATLKRLANTLETVSFDLVKRQIAEDVMSTETMKQMVHVMQEHLLFHTTINLITSIEFDGDGCVMEEKKQATGYNSREIVN